MQDTLNAALAWAARGFAVFPLSPATNKPVVEDWPNVATKDEKRIRELWGDKPYNVGCHCEDMIVVDVDVKNGKGGLASMVDMDLPMDTLVVRTPSGGFHLYYKGPNVPNRVGKLAPGLDIRSKGGYVVAPGSARNGVPYSVDTDMPIREAPESLVAAAGVVREKVSAPAADVDEASALLRAIEWLQKDAEIAVEFAGGDATTFEVACYLRDLGLSEVHAFTAMAQYWNERCLPPWDFHELKGKVSNAYAYATGAAGAKSVEAEFAGINIVPVEPKEAPKWRWIDQGDDWRVNIDWLFYEALPTRGVGVLTGPSGSGKTFLAVDLARALATGTPFFGIEPDERGGTVILNAESPHSPRRRFAALESADRLPISALGIDSLGQKGALAALIEPLRAKAADMQTQFGVPLRLIILDTLSASGLLEDEQDNAKAAAAMRALGKLADALGVFLLILHHPTKDGRGERGAGALRGSADVMLTATREDYSPVRDLAITKARDGQERDLGTYTLPVVTLGQDDRGRPITSCIVSSGPASERSMRTPVNFEAFTEAANAAFDGPDHFIHDGGTWVRFEDLKNIFADLKSGSRDRHNVNQQFDRCLRYAVHTGLVNRASFDKHDNIGRVGV